MKKGFRQQKGFSLVELMVAVAIIAVLSTLSIVALKGIRQSGRDSRRVADIAQLQLALKTFYNENGFYPTAITAGQSIVMNGRSYLLAVPDNPEPRDDGTCPDEGYVYSPVEDGQRYALRFCLASRSNSLAGGSHTATADGIIACPAGYVRVIGNAEFGTTDFCAMQYEAKCDSDKGSLTGDGTYDNSDKPCEGAYSIASQPTYPPIGNISFAQARAYCHTAGGHLMTNAEWMTIARDAELNPANWTDGIQGNGIMPQGNHAGGLVLDGAWEYANGIDSTDLEHRRTMQLSSGDKIWDMAGNVEEFVDGQCKTGSGKGRFYDSGSIIAWTDSNLADYELDLLGPKDSTPEEIFYGSYVGCPLDGNPIIRGGEVRSDGANDQNGAGIYYANMSVSEGGVMPRLGFRCVK